MLRRAKEGERHPGRMKAEWRNKDKNERERQRDIGGAK